MHTREVKVRGKMKTAKPTAKTENGFAPSIKVEKNNKNKLTFKIDKANKVTSAKMYQVIDGKVNSKEVKLEDMKKTGDYITSFTFAKEGMYRLKLLNKSGESAASITDFIINRKDNTETWRINESPRVEKSTGEKNMQKIKISDGAIKSIKIFVKGSNGYDLTKPIYKYENGQVKETTAKYIDESKSSYKDKNNIYIALKRSSSAMTKYLIQVTDQGGNDPELIKNRLIHVEKVATTKSSAKTVKNDTSQKKTDSSSNTQKVNENNKQTTTQKNTNSSNTNSVQKNSSPTLKWDSSNLELRVTDPDGIASVISFEKGVGEKFKPDRSTKDGKTVIYKLKANTSVKARFRVRVKDNAGKKQWTNRITLQLSTSTKVKKNHNTTYNIKNDRIIVRDLDGLKASKIKIGGSGKDLVTNVVTSNDEKQVTIYIQKRSRYIGTVWSIMRKTRYNNFEIKISGYDDKENKLRKETIKGSQIPN